MGTDYRKCLINANLFDLLQRHFNICRKLPVVCTNKCGLRDIPREKVCFITLSVLISLTMGSKTLRLKTEVFETDSAQRSSNKCKNYLGILFKTTHFTSFL